MTQPESQVPPTFGQSQVRGGFRGGRGGGLAQLHIGGPQITAPPPPKEDVKIVAGGDSGRPRRASEVKQQQQVVNGELFFFFKLAHLCSS